MYSVKSNIVEVETLEIYTNYDYYAAKLGEPVEISYKIKGGSGKYQVETYWTLYDKDNDTMINLSEQRNKSSTGEGTVSFTPQSGTQLDLNIFAVDQKNKMLIDSYGSESRLCQKNRGGACSLCGQHIPCL